jgi:hypothetical protein
VPNQGTLCSPSAGADCIYSLGCGTFSLGINSNENHRIYADVSGTSNSDLTGYSFSVKATSYGPESIYTTYLRDDRTDDVNTATHFTRNILLRKSQFFSINVENPDGEEGATISFSKIVTTGTVIAPVAAAFDATLFSEDDCTVLAFESYTCNQDPCREFNFTITRDVTLARYSDSNYTVVLRNRVDEDIPMTVSLTMGERTCRGAQNSLSFCKNVNIRGLSTIGFARYPFRTEQDAINADAFAAAQYGQFSPYFQPDDEHCADVLKEFVCEDNFRKCNGNGVHSEYLMDCQRIYDACGNQSCFRLGCKNQIRAYSGASSLTFSLVAAILSLALYFY